MGGGLNDFYTPLTIRFGFFVCQIPTKFFLVTDLAYVGAHGINNIEHFPFGDFEQTHKIRGRREISKA